MLIKYLALFLLMTAFVQAQSEWPAYIPDRDFEWREGNCKIQLPDKRIYQKVEIDPRFGELDRNTFKARLSVLSDRLALEGGEEGVIKLKLFFPLEGAFCITGIGLQQIQINEDQRLTLLGELAAMGPFTPGQQQRDDFSCTALLYLYIKRSKIVDYRAKNFKFSDEPVEGR
ncbi:hypothetical protein [Flavilitoribacter nigricans]|uniref:Uncharacterized protein n=1 Tax=Flavilitoribacter nigricans (strain ATCC 23147 / DSM 23189 / NBRC 102662 / NCIMB 1420 / SS-2) TaxID=1122177 RepID=A0A2D0NII4_FLAN2|nr:hypothetical protein [Flavilitoribacter nigricans]PHN08304.1 hypothetical protein CRP01_02990 [Flavilitoribacter nigricans DSM 23189 = NBRC 102662]